MQQETNLANLVKTSLKIEKVKLKNLEINYVVCGVGHPLILVHGANIGWGQWYKNIAYLSQHYTVYALDLPGSAGSTKIEYSRKDFGEILVESLSEFIRKLKLEKPHIVGHSIGGFVAAKVFLKNSNAYGKLVLINPLGLIDYVPAEYKLTTIHFIALLLSKTLMKPSFFSTKQFLLSAFFDKSKLEEIFVNYTLESTIRSRVTHPLMLMNRISGFNHVYKEFLLKDEIDKLPEDTLVLLGSNDVSSPAKFILAEVHKHKNLRTYIFEDTSHVPFLEKPAAFNRLLLTYLRES